jgi:5'-3' exonuclease
MTIINKIESIANDNKIFIFIDGSYFCFYRYYCLTNWWKNAYPDSPLENPSENETFVEKFRSTFIKAIQEIPKKLKLDKNLKPTFIVGRDCPRSQIWRNEFTNNYKSHRQNDNFVGFFFKMVYNEELFQKGGVKLTLSHSHLEADDCIAITVKEVQKKWPESINYIITSDKDYLQLVNNNIKLFNLHYKNLSENKSSLGNPELNLFCKILTGDPSDNIKPIWPKCGEKTAIKCFNDKEYFQKKLNESSEYLKNYETNTLLIDFNKIPENLVKEFLNS